MTDETRPYRMIDLTSKQLARLPMWARLAFARADVDIIIRDGCYTALKSCIASMDANDGDALANAAQDGRDAIARVEGQFVKGRNQ